MEMCIPYEGNEALLGTTDSLKPKRWRAERGEWYWSIADTGKPVRVIETNSSYDNDRFEIGNYFRTKEEAQAMADRFKEMLKGGNK